MKHLSPTLRMFWFQLIVALTTSQINMALQFFKIVYTQENINAIKGLKDEIDIHTLTPSQQATLYFLQDQQVFDSLHKAIQQGDLRMKQSGIPLTKSESAQLKEFLTIYNEEDIDLIKEMQSNLIQYNLKAFDYLKQGSVALIKSSAQIAIRRTIKGIRNSGDGMGQLIKGAIQLGVGVPSLAIFILGSFMEITVVTPIWNQMRNVVDMIGNWRRRFKKKSKFDGGEMKLDTDTMERGVSGISTASVETAPLSDFEGIDPEIDIKSPSFFDIKLGEGTRFVDPVIVEATEHPKKIIK
eukprot:NODE_47_length_32105_cov_1.240892.p11 type:complete len:297 gc:universal NODE_47_length_32105_cov_1.240892:29771-28881(-)